MKLSFITGDNKWRWVQTTFVIR